MEIKIFVARHRHSYGIGLSAKIAEENMVENAYPRVEAYRDDAILFPNPMDRGECVDFANEAVESLDKREKFLSEFREGGRMAECPVGITHVWVDDMGSIGWQGGPENAEVKYLKYSPDTVPSWT